jgi:hypothetical protein
VWDIIKRIAFSLLPVPAHNSVEPDEIFKWRQTVAAAIIIEGLILMSFIATALGYLTFAGITGFASTADLAPLVKQGHETRITQIETRITNDRTLQCQAIMERNQAAMNYSYYRLQEDVDAYHAVTNLPPRIPECNELIPVAADAVINAPTPRPSPAAK